MKTQQEQIEEIADIKSVLIKTHKRCRTLQEDYMQNKYAEEIYKAGYRKASNVLERADDLLHDLAMSYAERGHKDFFAVCEEVHHKVIEKLAAEIRQEGNKE